MNVTFPSLSIEDPSFRSVASPGGSECTKAQETLRQIRAQMASNPAYAPNRVRDASYAQMYEDGIQDQFQAGIQAAEDWKRTVSQGAAKTQTLNFGNGKASWLHLAASAIGLLVPFAGERSLIDREGFKTLFDPQNQLKPAQLDCLMKTLDQVDGHINSNKRYPAVSVLDALPLVDYFDRGGGKFLQRLNITPSKRKAALVSIDHQITKEETRQKLLKFWQQTYKAMICPLAQPKVDPDWPTT